MNRWLVGAFDPSGRTEASQLGGALGRSDARTLESGPLRLAYSGPPLPAGEPICLLDGVLDNAGELRDELGIDAGATDEDLLVAGHRRWGRGLPARLRGDFVLLIWDAEHG